MTCSNYLSDHYAFQDDVKSYCLLIADEMDGEVDFDLPGNLLPSVDKTNDYTAPNLFILMKCLI